MDLSETFRAALLADPASGGAMPAYSGSKTVFTRRPVPSGAPYPMIIVSPDVAVTDEDGVNDERPVIIRDISVYGQNDKAENYREVVTVAYAIRQLFHRSRHVISLAGYDVIDLVANGPVTAPTDDDATVGRIVTLTTRLARA